MLHDIIVARSAIAVVLLYATAIDGVALRSGFSVILDATFLDDAPRAQARALAESLGAGCVRIRQWEVALGGQDAGDVGVAQQARHRRRRPERRHAAGSRAQRASSAEQHADAGYRGGRGGGAVSGRQPAVHR